MEAVLGAAVAGAASVADRRRCLADAIMQLSLEPATQKRYNASLREFERLFGPLVLMLTTGRVVRHLCDYVAQAFDDGVPSRAPTMVAAVARAWKLQRGENLRSDERIGMNLKALQKLKNLKCPPKPKRDPLPVEALVHFVRNPPPEMHPRLHLAAAALLSVGVRCIRRPGELAGLRETDLVCTGPAARRSQWRSPKPTPRREACACRSSGASLWRARSRVSIGTFGW